MQNFMNIIFFVPNIFFNSCYIPTLYELLGWQQCGRVKFFQLNVWMYRFSSGDRCKNMFISKKYINIHKFTAIQVSSCLRLLNWYLILYINWKFMYLVCEKLMEKTNAQISLGLFQNVFIFYISCCHSKSFVVNLKLRI